MLKFSLALGTALAVLLPVAAQAQVYDPFPVDDCPTVVINYICRSTMPNDTPIFYAIPAGYEGRYTLAANRIPGGSLVLMSDNINGDVAAYIYLGNSNRTNRPDAGGNLTLLEEVEDEIVEIVTELNLLRP